MSSSLSQPIVGDIGTSPDEGLRDSTGAIYQGWKTATASMLCAIGGPSCILVFCLGSFVVPFQQEFGWSVGAISLGAALISLMLIVTALLGGVLVDRVNSRHLILWSMPLFAAGVAAMSLLPSNIYVYYAALVGVAILGLGVWPVTYTRATVSWFDKNLGFSLGLIYSGLGIGAALFPGLLAYVIPTYGWRTAFVMLGIAALLPWPIAALWLRENRVSAAAREAAKVASPSTGLTFKEAVATREFKLIVLGFAILGASSTGVIAHQVRIFVDSGVPMSTAIALQSVLGISLLVGRLVTGWLIDRLSAPRLLAVLCVAAAAAIGLLAAGSPFSTAAVSAVLVGVLIGAEFDVLGFLIPRYFGRRAFGAIWGALFSAFQLFAAIAIALSGIARTQLGSYAVPLTVLALLLLVASVSFASLGPYRFVAAGRK